MANSISSWYGRLPGKGYGMKCDIQAVKTRSGAFYVFPRNFPVKFGLFQLNDRTFRKIFYIKLNQDAYGK